VCAARSSVDRLERFLGLSELLTGFGRVDLIGTGMADEYLGAIDSAVSASVVDEALAAYGRLPPGPDREEATAATVLKDPKIGPIARNLIVLWYSGAWSQLPETWRAAYGASPLDASRVVSAAAYLAGLQWTVAGAHPPGAQAQGFGAWAAAPVNV
jgi:hypothetical protein